MSTCTGCATNIPAGLVGCLPCALAVPRDDMATAFPRVMEASAGENWLAAHRGQAPAAPERLRRTVRRKA